jgi:hypothetical protein
MRVIAKTNGNCEACGRVIQAGQQYDFGVRGVRALCIGCSLRDQPEQLAVFLGYLPHSDAVRLDWTK